MDTATRNFVRERAEHRCEYCRIAEAAYPISFHVEHIVASAHHRDDAPSNLAWACPRCNAYKGPNLATVDPLTGVQVTLFSPREQAWHEHFTSQEHRIEGLTPTGRGTVHLLQMNQPQRIELRRIYSKAE